MKILAILLVLSSLLLATSCDYYCQIWGDNSLGSDFTLMEGDRLRDRTIIYCTGTSDGCCQAGLPILPSVESPYNGKMYIASALAYPHWIVAKAVHQDKTISYWFLDKSLSSNLAASSNDSILESNIQAHVIGPLTLLAFQTKARQLRIPIDFKRIE